VRERAADVPQSDARHWPPKVALRHDLPGYRTDRHFANMAKDRTYGAEEASLFDAVDKGRIRALVTPITVAEVVSGSLKARKEALAERYRRTLTQSPGWSTRAIDADVAVLAARLRLRHGLKLPDAIQLAVALEEGCYALITHGRDFSGVTDVLLLGASARAR
jgi:predicted nucleic acid-binding protein